MHSCMHLALCDYHTDVGGRITILRSVSNKAERMIQGEAAAASNLAARWVILHLGPLQAICRHTTGDTDRHRPNNINPVSTASKPLALDIFFSQFVLYGIEDSKPAFGKCERNIVRRCSRATDEWTDGQVDFHKTFGYMTPSTQ